MLTFIAKKTKTEQTLKVGHPLTLLNCDYKIFSKLVATRLQNAITDLLDHLKPNQLMIKQGSGIIHAKR